MTIATIARWAARLRVAKLISYFLTGLVFFLLTGRFFGWPDPSEGLEGLLHRAFFLSLAVWTAIDVIRWPPGSSDDRRG